MAINWEPKQQANFGVSRYVLAVVAGFVIAFVYVFGR